MFSPPIDHFHLLLGSHLFTVAHHGRSLSEHRVIILFLLLLVHFLSATTSLL